MDDRAIVGANTAPDRSPSIEQALRELAQMPITEACLSGLCDMCLYQTGACRIFGRRWQHSPLPRLPRE